MLSWKLILLSAAVMFAAVGLKASVPVAAANLPLIWSFFLVCLKPPYLFVILNAIIISVVASSRFHHSTPLPPPPPQSSPVLLIPESQPLQLESSRALVVSEPQILEVKAVLVDGSPEQEEQEKKVVIEDETTAKRTNSTEFLSPPEKPLVSARFPHRKFLKSTSEGGRALKVVAKAKRHETLENTWKAITEGRSMPLSRHIMKKCDTWQTRNTFNPPENNSEVETFDDALAVPPGRLRKEPSLSQDELNRRVESFIRKFNEEMRLQRQQSLEQYMQMINRGAA